MESCCQDWLLLDNKDYHNLDLSSILSPVESLCKHVNLHEMKMVPKNGSQVWFSTMKFEKIEILGRVYTRPKPRKTLKSSKFYWSKAENWTTRIYTRIWV